MNYFGVKIVEAQSPVVPIYTIYNDAAGSENITTTAQSLSWDTQISENAEIPIDITAREFDLSAGGHYLVMYSVPVRSSGGTDRSEVQSWLRINGTEDSAYGYASSYIRRIDGDNDGYNESAAVIDVAAGDDIDIRIQKTDTHTATIERTPDRSGINILKLDDTLSYARLKPSSPQTITTSWEKVALGTIDELDSPAYSISGDDITLEQAGKYLVTYNVGTITTGTDRTNNEMRLTLGGVEIDATRSTAYTRAQQGSFVGIGSYVGVIETNSIDEVLNLEIIRESTLQGDTNNIIPDKTGLTITRLPDTADYVRIGEVTGEQDITTTTNTPITFDTTLEEDLSSFDHDNVNREQIDITQGGNYLFFHNIYNSRTSNSNGPRESPFLEWEHNGIALRYGVSGSYNRAANDGDGISNSSSSSAGIIVPNVLSGDTIELVETNEASAGSSVYVDERIGIQGINLDTLFSPRAFITQNHFRFRDDSADLDVSSGWLGGEDEEIENVKRNQTYRVRISVANEGQLSEGNDKQFRLEWGDAASGTCVGISTWNQFSTINDPWDVSQTAHISPNGEVSSIGLLENNEGFNFLDTRGYDAANLETSFIAGSTVNSLDYKEYEFSVLPTDYAVNGHRYCFRMYDIENDVTLDRYNYPSMILDETPIQNLADWGEAGSILAPANGGWTTLNFSGQGYVNPVIVGRTNTHNDINEALVFESRNITSTSAQVRLCDSDSGNSTGCQNHLAETIGYIVVDADKTDSVNGVEAGTFVENTSIDTTGGLTVTSYNEIFASIPYVFTSIQSTNGDTPIVTRVTSSDISSFTAGICQQTSTDGCNGGHPNETVGWIAIEPGFDGFGVDRQIGTGLSTTPSNIWTSVTFSASFSATPAVISQTVTNLGGQDVQIDEIQEVTSTGMEFRSCELDTDDDCDTHAIDTVRWLAVEQGVFSPVVVGTYNFDLTNYRWYANADSVTPGFPLSNENTVLTSLPSSGEVRLRALVQNGIMELTTGTAAYSLQYATGSSCESLTNWTNVGNSGGTQDWLTFNNPTLVSGDEITSSLLFGGGHVLETYDETIPAAPNPNVVPIGQWGEWDFSLIANNISANSEYCFRITGRGQPIHHTVYAQIDLQDTTAPIISSFTPGSGALLPIGNFNITYNYSDSESGIDDSSENIQLQRWDGSVWGADISLVNITTVSVSSTGALYNSVNLPFGRYRVTFEISDNAGNLATQEHEIFIDEIEFIISQAEVDIGNIGFGGAVVTSDDELVVTVKTVGAGFRVSMNPNQDLLGGGENIPIFNGTTGFGYQEPPYTGLPLSHSGGVIIGTEGASINEDGFKNVYEFTLRYSAMLDVLENYIAGDYQGSVDFGIEIDY